MINRIAVLLTVFNRKKQTILCLDSLFRQEIPEDYSISVFLTDDGCTDGTTQAVLQQFPSKVNIIQGDGNLFWNRGMWTAWNIAAKEYDYDFYLWLNDDTVLKEGALARHWGVAGVLIVPTFAYVLQGIMARIQLMKLINGTAKGLYVK